MVARIDTLGDRVKIATTELVQDFPEFREIIVELGMQTLLRIEALLRDDICDDKRVDSLCDLMAAFMWAHRHDMPKELVDSIMNIRLDLIFQLFQKAITFDKPRALRSGDDSIFADDLMNFGVRK